MSEMVIAQLKVRQLGEIISLLMSYVVAGNADGSASKSTSGFSLSKVIVVLAISVSLIVIEMGAGHST